MDFNVSTMELCVMVMLDVMTSQTNLQRFAMVCGVLIAPSVFSNLYLKDVLQYLYELSITYELRLFDRKAYPFSQKEITTH